MVAAKPGIGFDEEGLLSQTAAGHAPAWRSEHRTVTQTTNTNDSAGTAAAAAGSRTLLVATKISPTGVAERSSGPCQLDLSEWEVALESGDPILEIHIPEGSPMAMEACGEGLKRTLRDYSSWSTHEDTTTAAKARTKTTRQVEGESEADDAGTGTESDAVEGYEWVGFTCSSWMLDPHYPMLLPSSSNIVKLQRET